MTVDQAIQKIKRQYPDLDKTREADYEFGFDRYDPADIDKMVEHFFDNYEYQNPPKWAWFNKASYKLGIQRKEKKIPSWWKCQDCGCHYSIVGRGCPKCRSTKALAVKGENMPNDFVMVTEDCHYCNIFFESKKKENEKLCFGNDCEKHGIERTFQYCGSCQCRECCTQMIQFNNYPRETIEKYRTGELAQPWLIPVDALNETVKQMVNDIAKRRSI